MRGDRARRPGAPACEPHQALDAVFDQGFITLADDGAIVVSEALDAEARAVLGLDEPLCARDITDGHRGYLPWHRERVFQRGRK
jgi:putative restriction endonuclease